MNVLFLINKKETPSSRIRIINLLPFLKERGLVVDVQEIEKNRFRRIKQFINCRKYDVVVLQKKMFSFLEVKLLRKCCRKLIYDVDDAIYLKAGSCSTDPKKHYNRKREFRFRTIIKSCDGVITSNKILQSKVKSIRPDMDVAVIPSAVEVEELEQKKNFKISSTPMIGWIGTEKTQRYLEYILPALKKVNKIAPFILNVISSVAPSYDGLEVKFTPWDVKGQYEELQKCDIAIMPLSPDPFSEGKAAYKLLQYMACGVPSVCSAVGMNIDVSDNDKYCLCANGFDEFADKVVLLLGDESKRKELSSLGHKLVEDSYSQDVVSRKLYNYVKKIGLC